VIFGCGVDLGGTTTKIVVVDEQLHVLDRSSLPTDEGGGPSAMVSRLTSLFAELELRYGRLAAVGLSMAGLVDRRGVVVEAPNLPAFVGFDMVGALRAERQKLALVFENDVNCAVVGEHRRGAGRGCQDLCMLSLGTGVGGGILIGGKLFHGWGGLAAEFGHLVLDVDGPLCTCGKPGHVEAYLSTVAIVERARRHLRDRDPQSRSSLAEALEEGQPLSPKLIARCAEEGDGIGRAVLTECGHYLGAACASVAHALHPQRILVGGGVSGAGEWLLRPTRDSFARFAMDSVRSTGEVKRAQLGAESAALGAAGLALDAVR